MIADTVMEIMTSLRHLFLARPKLATYELCCSTCRTCVTGLDSYARAVDLWHAHKRGTGHHAKIKEV